MSNCGLCLTFPLFCSLQQQLIVSPPGHHPLILLFIRVLHISHKVLSVLLSLVLAVSSVSKHWHPQVAQHQLHQPHRDSETLDQAGDYAEVDTTHETDDGVETPGPGDVPLSDEPADNLDTETSEEDGGDDADDHLHWHGHDSVVELTRAGDGGVPGHDDQVDGAQVHEVQSSWYHVDDEDETVTNKFEHFSTLLSKKHGSVDYWGDITDDRINEADDTIADIADGVDDEVSEQTETIQE